jgi:hypothetical protein
MSALGQYILERLPRVYSTNEYSVAIVAALQNITAELSSQEVITLSDLTAARLESQTLNANVEKVNNIKVTGSGQLGNEWGPE